MDKLLCSFALILAFNCQLASARLTEKFCTETSECKGDKQFCYGNLCLCPLGTKPLGDQQNCLPDPCTSQQWCQAQFGEFSWCDGQRGCACAPGFHLDYDGTRRCQSNVPTTTLPPTTPTLGHRCKSNGDCVGENQLCRENFCQCEFSFKPTDGERCERFKCSTDSDCLYYVDGNSFCSMDWCFCKTGYELDREDQICKVQTLRTTLKYLNSRTTTAAPSTIATKKFSTPETIYPNFVPNHKDPSNINIISINRSDSTHGYFLVMAVVTLHLICFLKPLL